MSFITPAALAMGLLSVPIILMYMLRLRRTEMNISSNFLWQQLVRDREANAPWQRLRFSWLLLLQLLILAALVLALARPFQEVKTISSGRIVLLLDASASMAATDVSPSRFEQSQQIAEALVDTLGDEDTMTVIRVADVPDVLISSSQDKSAIRNAIRGAEISDSTGDWFAALTLAAAGAKGVEQLNVVIVTDGGLPGNLPEIPGNIRVVLVGEESENLAITALATRAVGGGEPQLFAQITNYGTQDAETIFSLSLDGELFSAQRYAVPAGQHVDVLTEDLPDNFRELEATLSVPSGSNVPDYLDSDNTAYAVYSAGGAGRVLLMTPRNIFLSEIFSSLPGVQLTQGDPANGLPRGEFDLYVFDSWLPSRLPEGDLFIINPPGSTELFTVTGTIEDINRARVSFIKPDDPRTEFLDFKNVNIRSFQSVRGFEDWAETMIEAEAGPLLLAGEVNNRQVAILTFALQESDLPLQIAWPVLVSNLTRWYTPPRALDVGDSIAPGTALPIRPYAGDSVQVTLPNGERVTLEMGETAQVAFADTNRAGIYTVEIRDADRTLATEVFAVNLFSPLESNIAPRESVLIGTVAFSDAVREDIGQREWWRELAVLGLIILLVEWLLYHRAALRKPSAGVPAFIDSRLPRRRFLGWRRS